MKAFRYKLKPGEKAGVHNIRRWDLLDTRVIDYDTKPPTQRTITSWAFTETHIEIITDGKGKPFLTVDLSTGKHEYQKPEDVPEGNVAGIEWR